MSHISFSSIMAMAMVLLVGCGPKVKVLPPGDVPPTEAAAAASVAVYTVGIAFPSNRVENVHGPVEAYSCKHLLWDPPASQGEALQALKIEAARLGANAILDVTFDTRGTDALGTNCWETVYASGLAATITK